MGQGSVWVCTDMVRKAMLMHQWGAVGAQYGCHENCFKEMNSAKWIDF